MDSLPKVPWGEYKGMVILPNCLYNIDGSISTCPSVQGYTPEQLFGPNYTMGIFYPEPKSHMFLSDDIAQVKADIKQLKNILKIT